MSEILNLDNFQKQVSKLIINKAKNLTVRDLDLTDNNTYIAYVDDGEESYDVSVKLNNNEIVAHSCDCDHATGLCEHKIAMLVFLKKHLKEEATKKKEAEKSKKTKVKSGVEVWLAQAEPQKLQAWLLQKFKSYPLLKIDFENDFAPEKTNYTVKDIKKIFSDLLKTLGRVKHISKSETKTFVSGLKTGLKPIYQYLEKSTDPENAIELYLYLIDELGSANKAKQFQGMDVADFFDDCVADFLNLIGNKVYEDWWYEILDAVLDIAIKSRWEKETSKQLIDFAEHNKPAAFVLAELIFEKRKSISPYNVGLMALSVLYSLEENTFLERLDGFIEFKAEPSYGVLLVNAMLKYNEYDKATKLLHSYLEPAGSFYFGNSYKPKIYDLLISTYLKQGDRKNMIKAMALSLVDDFNLKNYKTKKQKSNLNQEESAEYYRIVEHYFKGKMCYESDLVGLYMVEKDLDKLMAGAKCIQNYVFTVYEHREEFKDHPVEFLKLSAQIFKTPSVNYYHELERYCLYISETCPKAEVATFLETYSNNKFAKQLKLNLNLP